MLRTTVLAALVGAAVSDFPQMNKDVTYTVANPRPGAEGKAMKFHGQGFFTVDTAKFKSQYSQVIWRSVGVAPLPTEIVKKYDGKVMSVTGWEVDVLRIGPNGTEEHVPCYESYNHRESTNL